MRTIDQALANAARIRDELPYLIQPSATDYDMVLLAARLAEAIAERDSIRTMLLNERNEWMDEAIRRQASVNQNLAALVTDAQEELRKCQQDAIQLQARLAEAEELLRRAMQAVEFYDSNFCSDGPQLLPKIESFLASGGVS